MASANAIASSDSGIEAAVVSPEKSRYPAELIEVIAPVKLRALGLEDGDPF